MDRSGKERVSGDNDEKMAVVLSGGNVEVNRIGELIAGATTLPGARA